MALVDEFKAAQETPLVQRVAAALFYVARDVFIEDAQTAKHEERKALALRVISNPHGWAARFALALTTVMDVTEDSTDEQLKTGCASAWNFYAAAVTAGVV